MRNRGVRAGAQALVVLLLACCRPNEPASLEEIASRALPYVDSAEKEAIVEGINSFALELYAGLAASDEGNLFFSPFSISTALAMTYAGARGNTAAEMADALHFSLTQDALHAAYGALLGDMDAVAELDGYELSTANSLWGQEGFGFLLAFLDVLEDSYGAPLHEVDFTGESEQVRVQINDWVAGQTHNRILDLLEQGSIDAATRLVLANALYFKGAWARAFDDGDTADGVFYLADGTPVTVPLMHQTAELNYMRNELVSMLELPYTTGDLSMLFILPQSGLRLDDVEETLTVEVLALWSSELEPQLELDVAIPSFGFTATFRLAEELGAMGMVDAFTTDADFSGMDGSMDLVIGDVFHKAFVEVNEEGTEAAAATAVTVGVTSAGPGFVADRPFLFLIRHNRSGAILFFGRVSDPRGERAQ